MKKSQSSSKSNFKYDKLNLGCSIFRKPGFVNIDIEEVRNPDVVYDLNKTPYPIADNSFSLIEADHVLEHLHDPFRVMKELHRILKDNGKLVIRVPHFSRGFTHPDHKRGFDVSFPLYFNKKYAAFFCGTDFELVSMKLTWFAQPYVKKISMSKSQYYAGLFLDSIFTPLARLSPYFCSRIWCFLVGGFEEIEYIFKKNGNK